MENLITQESKLESGLNSILSGLQMLSETKEKELSALAELSIILLDNKTRHYFGLDNESGDDIRNLLGSVHYIIKNINAECVEALADLIHTKTYKEDKQAA